MAGILCREAIFGVSHFVLFTPSAKSHVLFTVNPYCIHTKAGALLGRRRYTLLHGRGLISAQQRGNKAVMQTAIIMSRRAQISKTNWDLLSIAHAQNDLEYILQQ